MSKRNTEIMGFLNPQKIHPKGLHKGDQKPSSSLSNEFLEFFQMHLKLLKSRNDPIKFSKKWSKITL